MALGFSPNFYAERATAWAVVSLLAFLVVATVAFWRWPDNPMAILMSLWLVVLLPRYFNPLGDALPQTAPGWHWPVAIVRSLGYWSSLIIAYLFPNGKFVPGWARLVVLPVTAFALLPLFSIRLPNAVLLGFLLVGIATQVYRYRRVSSPTEQQQTKWVVLPLVLFNLGLVGFDLTPLSFPALHVGVVSLF